MAEELPAVLSEALVAAETSILSIDPGQLRPEFYGLSSAANFGPPRSIRTFARGEVFSSQRPIKGFRHRNQLVHIPAGGKNAGVTRQSSKNGRFIIMVIYGYQPDAFPFAQQALFPILFTRFRCQYHEPGSTAALEIGNAFSSSSTPAAVLSRDRTFIRRACGQRRGG